MTHKPKAKTKPPAETGQAMTLAKLLDTPDPLEQVARLQQLLALAAAPVLTLVIQVDTRAPGEQVTLSNIGPAIPGHTAHMMLAAAQRQLAQATAEAAAKGRE